MKTLDDFLPRLLPYVPGCPDLLVRQGLVESAIEFCARTQIAQTLSTLTLREGRAAYDIELPAQQALVNVLDVLCDGLPLDPVSWPVAELPPGRPQWVIKPLPSVNELTVVPTPDAQAAGKRLTVLAAFKPAPKATMLADELFADWHDAVVQGAIRRLCAMPSQPFSATGAVVMAATAFESYVADARLVARKRRLVHATRVTPRPLV